MRTPVSLFIRQSSKGPVWYAKLLDQDTGETVIRSTGIIAQGRGKGRSLAEEKARTLLGAIAKKHDPVFLDFVAAFWKDDGRYARFKINVEKTPLSLQYLANNRRVIRLHVTPFEKFKGIRLSQVRRGLIDDWKLWATEKGTGSRTVNYALQAIKVAVNDAYNRGDIPINPISSAKPAKHVSAEKGLLTAKEVTALIQIPEHDERVRLAVLLALLGGLRRGEIRGLRWTDLDEEENIINVRNNYVDGEGDKAPKWGSGRRVFLHSKIKEALADIQTKANSEYVLFNPITNTPLTETILKDGFVRMLKHIGIAPDERKRRNITLHGMRHQFITNCLMAGMQAAETQALAGHRTSRMMDRYTHGAQVLDFDKARGKMEQATRGETQAASE